MKDNELFKDGFLTCGYPPIVPLRNEKKLVRQLWKKLLDPTTIWNNELINENTNFDMLNFMKKKKYKIKRILKKK